MTKHRYRLGCIVLFGVLALVSLAFSLFMWFGFNKIYNNIVDEQIVLKQEEDGQLTKFTFLFMHPPADAVSYYYIFNVKNPTQVEFFGEKPIVEETGPFAIRVVENKWNYTFLEDGEVLRYKNYKTFYYEAALSCGICSYNAYVIIPNLVAIGTIEELLDTERYHVSKTEIILIDLLLLLVGEYSFVRVRFGELLFDGYEDPLLTIAHSQLFADLTELNGGKPLIPVPIPDLTAMAFFFHYNNTNDEVYEISTGKADLSTVGKIKTWANDSLLPEQWWSSTEARYIKGSDSGALQGPNLSKDKPISFYQSFMCRSFELGYKAEDKFRALDVYKFEGGAENFDTTLPEQSGFRYPNQEKINYYPDWPSCSNIYDPKKCKNTSVDCAQKENICTECCDGSKVNNTYILPPGMYTLSCFPGRKKEAPFRLLFTTPHFAGAPPEVISSIDGMKNLGVQKYPFSFKYMPRTGAGVEAILRFQVAVPIYQTNISIMASNFPNKIFPVLWVDNYGRIKDNVYDKLHLGFVVVPRIALALKIVSTVFFFLFILVDAYLICLPRRHAKVETPKDSRL